MLCVCVVCSITDIYLTYQIYYNNVKRNNTNTNTTDEGGDDDCDDSNSRKQYTSIGVRPSTKETVNHIQNITNKHQKDIVDEALADYLATEIEELVDKYDIVDEIKGENL